MSLIPVTNLPPVSLLPAANLPPVSLIPVAICHRCRWYWWCTLTCEYLREFSNKIVTVLMDYSGAGGKLIHQKNRKQKISWHCPFNVVIYLTLKLSYLLYEWTFDSMYTGNINALLELRSCRSAACVGQLTESTVYRLLCCCRNPETVQKRGRPSARAFPDR